MTIDSITVLAQLVNFLVLVLLLRWFLYRPILDGIDAREAEIARRMKAAGDAREDARAAETMHQAALATVEAQADSLRDEALTAAQVEAEAFEVKARDALAAEVNRWRESLTNEQADFLADVRSTAARAIVRLTRKSLHDLADAMLEDRIAQKLEAQLVTLGPELAAKSSGAVTALALSSFDLSKTRQQSLARAFRAHVTDRALEFQTDPTAPLGLVLQIGGARLGWSVDDYLDGLEAELATLLRTQIQRSADTP